MKAISLKIAAFLLIAFLIGTAQAKADNRKNVVLIQTDDLSMRLLNARYENRLGQKVPVMPNLERLVSSRGVQFVNHIAASPVCAPNRTALLSGRYPHTTRVVGNDGPYGGWQGWSLSDAYSNNFVNRLDQAGYHTAHFGKLTNYYGDNPADTVPPGWDTWMTDSDDESTRSYYGYNQMIKIDRTGQNGRFGPFGSASYGFSSNVDSPACRPFMSLMSRCFYHSDRMSAHAVDEIRYASSAQLPFYIQIDYHAPHGDKVNPPGPQPASRHILDAEKTTLPLQGINPNYNENTDQNINKPFLTREKNGPITRGYQAYPTSTWRRGIESMQSVDEGISSLISALKRTGEYDNTYFIFTSDNGYFYGDHRFLAAKFLAYQETARVPFIIEGPGVPRGVTNAPTSTVDIGPTVLDLTGTSRGSYTTDGKSIAGNIFGPQIYQENNRFSAYASRPQLIEFISTEEMSGFPNFSIVPSRPLGANRAANEAPPLKYRGIKIGRFKYVDYDNTSDELYDIYLDPEEMTNQIRNPAFATIRNFMKAQLEAQKNCSGDACLAPVTLPPFRTSK